MRNFEESFSKKLQQLRKSKKITQKQFAELLGYSEKTVSKWECGDAYPPLDVFAKICRILQVDSQFLLNYEEEKYILGVDGGGTKTTFLLQNEEGEVLSCITLGPSNPCDIGMNRCQAVLKEGIEKICSGISMYSVVAYAGIAGCLSGNNKAILLQFLNTFGFYKVDCGSDNDNIISAGLQGNDGITVIMGTGVCIFRIINGVRTQISGWGYLLDEGGSAFNLGREALSACYSSLDGSGPYTILAESIGVQTDNLGRSFLNRIYAEGKRLIASFAPNVLEAANLGDEVALEILKRNIQIVVQKLSYAAQIFVDNGQLANVVMTGGLAQHPTIQSMMCNAFEDNDKIRIDILKEPPVVGAVRLANLLLAEDI